MIRRAIILIYALALAFVGGIAHAQPEEAPPQPPRVHNAWETSEGGSKLLLQNEQGGGLSGYAVSPLGRKSWEIKGRIAPDRKVYLTRFVPKDEWSSAPDAFKDRAIEQLGGTSKPGFIESPMALTLSPDGKSLRGIYSREVIRYTAEEFVSVSRMQERLDYVQITDLLKALMWAAIAMGLVGGLLSMGLDFIPVVGDIKGLMESLSGRDAVTGEELAGWERALGALPLIGGALGTGAAIARLARRGGPMADLIGDMLRRVRSGERVLDSLSDVGRRADDVGDVARHGDDVADAARHGDDAADAGRHADDLHPPVTPGCFVAGTLVLCADGKHKAIEKVEQGDEVMAVPGGNLRPSRADPVARAVVSILSQTAARLVRLYISDGDETVSLTCTPRHPIATEAGYIAAEELQPGTALLRAGPGTPLIAQVELLEGPVEVFNLTVEADHCYFVGKLCVLVHNHCEWTTQQQMERFYDGHPEYGPPHMVGGRPVREPGYSNGQFTEIGRFEGRRPGMRRGEARLRDEAGAFNVDMNGYRKKDFNDRAFAEQTWTDMGRDPATLRSPPTTQQLNELQGHQRARIDREINSGRSGMTYPDDVRTWTDPTTGISQEVAIELKTPQRGSVYDHFTRYEGDITQEVWNRRRNMPNHTQELVVDLRNTGQSPQSAMNDLQRLADDRNAVGMENVGTFFDRVRFIEGGPNSPTLTSPFHFSP